MIRRGKYPVEIREQAVRMVFEHQDPERVSRDRCFTARCLGGDRRVVMRIQFGLLDNALDYLRWATEHTTEDEDRHWKQALLNLAAGIELLLKARLQEEHWSLLFADIDKASARRLRTGDFVSVDARTALSRLEEIAGVKLSDEDRQPLRVLREFRNGAQHFALDVEEEAVKALLARNLNFAVDFCHDHLKDQLTEERERILAEILEAANAFSAFVDERREVIAGRLAAAPAVYDCPTCVQENTLVLGEGDPECAFCRARFEPDYVADLGEGRLPWECMSCGRTTVLLVLYNNDWGVGLCSTCGCWQQRCLSCSHEFMGQSHICPGCGAIQG